MTRSIELKGDLAAWLSDSWSRIDPDQMALNG